MTMFPIQPGTCPDCYKPSQYALSDLALRCNTCADAQRKPKK